MSGRAATVPPVFEKNWHDWIVMKRGQLAAFTRYIRENPKRAWLRRENRQFFTRPGTLAFAGRHWFSYGNPALLALPVLEPFRCSRSWTADGPEWREALSRATRTGPGGAGVGTFLSPCEKACGNAIYRAGGAFIVLSPEGFPDRWHPARAKETLCAAGRMLFLTLWPPQAKWAPSSPPSGATRNNGCFSQPARGPAALPGRAFPQSTAFECNRLQSIFSPRPPFSRFPLAPRFL